MSKKYYPTTTDQLETFLGGAPLPDYTMPWSPHLYKGELETSQNDSPFVIQWSEGQKGIEVKHQLLVQVTSGTPDPINFAHRVFCHYLLSKLPDRGVSEVWDNIRDAYQFYTYIPKEYPALPVTKSVKAGKGSEYKRPDFEISGE